MVFHDFIILQIVICNRNNKLEIAGDFSWFFQNCFIKTVKYEFGRFHIHFRRNPRPFSFAQ